MSGDAARLVRALKYSGWTALAPKMGAALADPARRLILRAACSPGELCLVPVPVTRPRLRERGFNQAELLAAGLARALGLRTASLLESRDSSASQVRLSRTGRFTNVGDRFRARANEAGGDGFPVLAVDDVVTTGATALACLSALAAAGWRPIGLVSFARAWRVLDATGDSTSLM
ncbi:MAG: ComF family protein [Gemmatimonadota bacterium]|jgi:predicted amidophosphoribosyltransferase|nr:MAG: ComF family protein [Gemmatimonadota bacterium]